MDKKQLITALYNMGAIKFGRFTLKSGQQSPIYLNLREIISYPLLLQAVSDLLWEKTHSCAFDLLCGVPYTALPIATCMSIQHRVPMLIRRKEKKSYGTKQKIEGLFNAGQRCLIIEDIITSGSSILETAKDLEESGLLISDVAVLIDREQGGKENLQKTHYVVHPVLTLSEILNTLINTAQLSKTEHTIIHQLLNEKHRKTSDIATQKNLLEINTKRKSFAARVGFCKNPVARKLFSLMEAKQTNLALSADVTSGKQLLHLADRMGPEICILKTHIDIIEDFSQNLIKQLLALAHKHQFLIFEDRKFADIGHTAKQQYQGGIYHIADWADIINAHSLPGPGLVAGLAEIGLKKECGLLLLAQMSAANNLLSTDYTEKTLAIARQFPEFVIGFISQQKLLSDDQWLYMTPGVHLTTEGDKLGQQYVTPKQAILEYGNDIIIVGRGIIEANDPLSLAKQYRQAGWQAYQESLGAYEK